MDKLYLNWIKALVVFWLCTGTYSFGQQNVLHQLWPDSTLANANAGRSLDYLNQEEKEVIYYINLVRINPPLFAKTFLKEYVEEYDIDRDKYLKSLEKTLESSKKLTMLKPSQKLTEVARSHAKDMGASGRTGHNSTNGVSFAERMDEVVQIFSSITENCNYGFPDGRSIVMDLLIDRNVSNLGHRRNILSPDIAYIGVAIEPHKRWKWNCVQDFGGKKLQ